jgi:BirA family transcriptional regulator, biotin operon repressor / biotin---[acetyl-CoA-carboxylase] ligase
MPDDFPSRFSDLGRPPLDVAALRRALLEPGGLWSELRVVEETASTNADVVGAARNGAGEGLVLVAEVQHAGRGRLDRTWIAPPRSGLTFSVLLRPGSDVPAPRWGWIPLLAGSAVATALHRVTGLRASVKWPNDVLVDERKIAGLLAERVPDRMGNDAVVLGIGINVSLEAHELPVPTATSVRVAGATSWDRDPILRAVLRELAHAYAGWRLAGGDPDGRGGGGGVREDYREHSATLGREVTAHLPDGRAIEGNAAGIDADGCLVLLTPEEAVTVTAGDIVHLR